MNYEKLYKEALERAKKELDICGSQDCDAARQIFRLFPELKESEDEKIRKALVELVKCNERNGYTLLNNVSTSSMLAWLEKQGTKEVDPRYENLEELLVADNIYQMSMNEAMVEKAKSKAINALSELQISKLLGIEKQDEKPQGKTALEAAKEEKIDNSNKAEPKFKVGDWISNKGHSYLIASIDYEQGRYLFEIGGYTHEQLNWEYIYSADEKYHLWTIADAKPGDVLAAHECYVVFKEIDGLNIKCYCTHHYMNNPSFHVDTLHNKDAFHPATKEQRDTLFAKMREAGYEWNAEKKELKLLITNGGDFELEIKDEPENYKQQVMSEMTNLVKDYIRQK